MSTPSDAATWDEKREMWVRPGTMDAQIIDEARGYSRLMKVKRGQVETVCDIGSHIGGVTAKYLSEGALWVVAFEANPDNARLWRRNCERFGERAKLHELAVVGGSEPDAGEVDLLVSAGRNSGSHSVVSSDRSRRERVRVRAVGLGAVLTAYSPTLLKVDIEGGEYAMADELAALPSCVRGVAIEYHLKAVPDARDRALAIERSFLAQGFAPAREYPSFERSWFTMRVYLRGQSVSE